MSFTQTREEQFYSNALKENYRQVEKWGIQRHSVHEWLAILMEEVGEVAKASIDGSVMEPNVQDVITELIHVAAVAAAIASDKSWQRAK